MNLSEKLHRLQTIQKTRDQSDWEVYKNEWESAVNELQGQIMHGWLKEFEKEGSMKFTQNILALHDPFIGPYTTTALEIEVLGKDYIEIRPISSVTYEHDGRLDFQVLGSSEKVVNIVRIMKGKKTEWYLINPANYRKLSKLNEKSFRDQLDKWLK